MKKGEQTTRFDWSKKPSRDGVQAVYIANPGVYSSYGKDITRDELSNALSNWNKMNDLKAKKTLFRNLFIATLISIPIFSILYNVLNTLAQNPK